MSKFTWRTENQWAYYKDGGSIDLLRVSVYGSGWYVSGSVTLLGFGLGLTWWRMGLTPATSPWGAIIGGAVGGYIDPDVLKAPVESLGREHGE